MITFVTKHIRIIEKETLCSDSIYTQVEKIFRESQCEVILIYDKERYCGYVERMNMRDIYLPEFCLGFDPMEMGASDRLMDEIKEYFDSSVSRKIWIPIKDKSMGQVRDFAIDESDEQHLDESRLLVYLTNFLKRSDRMQVSQYGMDTEVIRLPKLNEFTWLCYRMFKRMGKSCIVQGMYWKHIDIFSDENVAEDKSEIEDCSVTLVSDLLEKYAKESISEVIESFRRSGVNAYKIVIPNSDELAMLDEVETRAHKEKFGPIYLKNKNYPDREFWLDHLMKTEGCEKEEELWDYQRPRKYGEEKQTVYLAGACIVGGYPTAEVGSLAYRLYQRLLKENVKYNVEILVKAHLDIALADDLEMLDIRENDIVVAIMDRHMYEKKADDIDLLEDYNNRPANSWWFLDGPIHTLRRGNEMIVDKLYPLLAEQYENRTSDNGYVQAGKTYLTGDQKIQLQEYISKTGFERKENHCVGCIVMNANPFTKGHLYLVEQAAAEVDELLVFVVEEDLSEFCFADRFQMVRQGVAHLDHVRVIPSGSFILSSHTFVSYFEKDKRQDEVVDCTLDIGLFGTYIVPAFGIDRRFVGEEPNDRVTQRYNEEMKRKLPLYGVTVKEIPRKEADGEVISATTVRKLYRMMDWKNLSLYLPDTTIDYLRLHKVVMREKENILRGADVPTSMRAGLERVLAEHKTVIFYGTGVDCNGLYLLLSDAEKSQIVFCDKRAKEETYQFNGEKVYNPKILLETFLAAPIIVTSTQFGCQIRTELMEMGILPGRLIRNVFSFWGKS